MQGYDYDWLVIGSGFGGSVSALRLAEKGYSVGVLECGSRFEDDDFVKSTLQARRYYWAPKLGMRGILRMTLLRDVFVLSGAGVGGGSLGFANVLYRPPERFFRDGNWAELNEDWQGELAPHYDEAERMLGAVDYEGEGPGDRILRELADELGVSDSYRHARVGVFFGEPGKTVPDPYFGGEGPPRAGCIRCGACMPGCRHNAKNTLMKNYLWFAERRGVEIEPGRLAVDVRPLGAPDGSDGYRVVSENPGAWFSRDRRETTARGVVFAAGPLGTNKLLLGCKQRGSLPRLSDRVGELVRSNSESIPAVTLRDDSHDFTDSVAITSSIHPDDDTHIQNITYGRGADSMFFLWTILTGPGTRLTRPLRFLATALRHPLTFVRASWPVHFSRRTMIVLVMQTVDNRMRLRAKRRLLGREVRLVTEQDSDAPNPSNIPIGDWVVRRAAEKLGGIPRSNTTEALLNTTMTAHVLGGAVMGPDAEHGVIDVDHRVFGYSNMLVCDGSAVPANLGVNPSLTITAMAERAMCKVPAKTPDSRQPAQSARE